MPEDRSAAILLQLRHRSKEAFHIARTLHLSTAAVAAKLVALRTQKLVSYDAKNQLWQITDLGQIWLHQHAPTLPANIHCLSSGAHSQQDLRDAVERLLSCTNCRLDLSLEGQWTATAPALLEALVARYGKIHVADEVQRAEHRRPSNRRTH